MSGPSGAREQVQRLLTLVPFLYARGEVRVSDAARALDTTPRQLLSDLKVLFMCGLPGGYPDDLIDVDLDALETDDGRPRADGVIRVSNADYLARPLRLTATEATAVIVALRALRAGADGETVDVVDRALAKLERAAAGGPADGPSVPLDVAAEPSAARARARDAALASLAARLRDAAARGVQVELDYYVPSRDELSHRTVDPRGVVEHGSHAYLDAWCHSAEAPRLFRLDRVAAARVLDVPVDTEPQAPRDLSDGLFGGLLGDPAGDQTDEAEASNPVTLVTLRLAAPARWVTEYYPVRSVRPAADGTPGALDVELRVADPRWLTKLLLRLAPNAYVIDPPDFAAAFTSAAQAALSLYRTAGA